MRFRHLVMAALFAVFLTVAPDAFAQNARGVTDTEILIGTYTDLTGAAAAWGAGSISGWRMAFDEINAKGGINGRKIRYIVEDTRYNVPRAILAANKLINRDGVFLMVANIGTPMNNANLPEQIEKGVPNVFPLSSARSMYEPFHKLKFSLAASYDDQMRAGVKYFIERKGKKALCALYQDSDFGNDVMTGVWAQLKAMGIKLAGEVAFKPPRADFSNALTRLRNAKCDLVILGTITRDTNVIVAEMRKTGWNVDVLGSIAIYDNTVADVPDDTNEGIYAMTAALALPPDDPRPAVREFMKKFQARYNRTPNFSAQIGYSAAYLLAEGLKNAGQGLTVDSFINGMEQIKSYKDIFGSPTLNFGPGKHQGSDESYLVRVHNRKWVPVLDQPISR